MARIPGIVYVAVGAMVTIVSLLMGEKLKIFFFAGLGLLAFGAVVSFIGALEYHREKGRKEKQSGKAQQGTVQMQQPFAQQQRHISPQQRRGFQQQPIHQPTNQPHYKMCMRCRTPMQLQDNFCSRCGARV